MKGDQISYGTHPAHGNPINGPTALNTWWIDDGDGVAVPMAIPIPGEWGSMTVEEAEKELRELGRSSAGALAVKS